MNEWGMVPNNEATENFDTSGEVDIDILELFYRLLENAGRIIAAALAGMLIAIIYSYIIATPVYEATCQIYVTNASDATINLSDMQIGNYLTSDYQKVFNAWEIHEAVRQNLDLSYDRNELREMLEVKNPSGTRILEITVTSEHPEEAATLANEYADVGSGYISRTMDTNEPKVLSSALIPEEPVRPHKLLNIALGFAIGAFLMIAVVLVQYLLDDRLKTEYDIASCADMAVLAVVPINGGSNADKKGAHRGSHKALHKTLMAGGAEQ